ncbi:ADP-ribosylation factor GTPase-activating protein AGD12-like isoform X4 [Abrus precatorius]|uniref:ADP-ribosylation factor GTPase-activating protein AGD12-like isoform X4 n=1 Tax=Abrus precatorius TaxID=3816 RepID=A0A8B8KQN5_ABRPR|nr:ADP-ribosylation factor GTPase-activating protein AGD12-like isoform X4 [Abrus precatorius]
MIGRSLTGKRRLKDLLVQKDNRFCADCNSPDPKWASANIGVFVCLKCCGVHRSLGTHISKILSVTLDDWSTDEIDGMIEVGGNSSANSIYEAYIPEGYTKPGPDASHEERAKFIRSKYEQQEFLKPSLRIVSGKSNTSSSFSKGIVVGFRSTSSSQNMEGMVEFIGTLKVKVIKGTDLAIRDIMTSDPYVILNLGQQIVQTTVIKSNLNPVWNEELVLSVPQQYGILNLVRLNFMILLENRNKLFMYPAIYSQITEENLGLPNSSTMHDTFMIVRPNPCIIYLNQTLFNASLLHPFSTLAIK